MNDTMPTIPPELAAALVAAQRGAQAVEKSSKHEHHKYKYVSADVMIAEGRSALGEAGLALMTRGWGFVPLEAPAVGEDVAGRVVVNYQLVHTSGASMAWQSSSFVIPGKGRPQDKAEMGAVTENLSYTIRGLLMLPRVDEGTSVETRRDEGYEPRRAPANDQRQGERERAPESSQRTAAAASSADPAHVALAAQFKQTLGELPSIDGFGDLVAQVDNAKLPPALLADVRAEIAVRGLAFAVDAEDLEFWVEKLRGWKLDGEPYERAGAAYDKAEERIERLAIQGAA